MTAVVVKQALGVRNDHEDRPFPPPTEEVSVPEATVALDVPILARLGLAPTRNGRVFVSHLGIGQVKRADGFLAAQVIAVFRLTPDGPAIYADRYVLTEVRDREDADCRRLTLVRRAIAHTLAEIARPHAVDDDVAPVPIAMPVPTAISASAMAA